MSSWFSLVVPARPRRSPRAVLGLLTAATLLVAVTPPLAPPAEASTTGGGVAAGEAATIPDAFTPYSKVTTGPDGTAVATISQVPAFTNFANGRWRAVDTTVRQGSRPDDPDAAYEVSGAYRPIKFGKTPQRLASLDLGRGRVRLSAEGLAASKAERGADGIVYREVAKDVDLTVQPSGAALRSVFRLKSAQSPTSFTFHLSDPAGALGAPTRTADGGYQFASAQDPDVFFGFRPAFAYEVSDNPEYMPGAEPGSAELTVTKAGDGYDITKTISPQWLEGKQFPVELDPLAFFGRGQTNATTRDCHLVSPPNDKTNYCSTTRMELGYGVDLGTSFVQRRMLTHFTLGSAIPQDALVTEGRLSLFLQNNFQSRTLEAGLWETGSTWLSTATWAQRSSGTPWTARPGDPIGGWPSTPLSTRQVGGTRDSQCFGSVNNWCHWDLTALAKRWVSGAAANNGVTLLANPETTTNAVMAFTTEEGASNWPYLRITFTPKPSAPQNVGASEDDGAATVTWQAPDNASQGAPTSYSITARRASDNVAVATAVCDSACISAGLRKQVTGLSNGTAYTFQVTGTNAAGEGAAGSTPAGSTYIPYGSPSAPTGVRTNAAVAAGSVDVSWDPSVTNGRPIASYSARAYVAGGGYVTALPCDQLCANGDRRVTFTGLENGQTYEFRVVAQTSTTVRNASGESGSAFATPYDRPGKPTNVSADVRPAAGEAQLTWTVPAANGSTITHYTLRAYPTGSPTAAATNVRPSPCTGPPCSITGLANGTSYQFTVQAHNARGASDESDRSASATPYGAPGAPTNVTADVNPAPNAATVTFTPPQSNGGSAISSYVVRAYTSNPRQVATGTTVTPSPCQASPCTVAGLTNGVSYTFTVAAVNARTQGAESADTAPAIPYGKPDAPSGVTADVSQAAGQATISWTAPKDNGRTISRYVVRAFTASPRQAASGTTVVPTPCTKSPCTVSGLMNGTAYVFTVSAVNSRDEGPQSPDSSAVTPYDRPGAPTQLTVSDGDGTATLAWQPPTSTNGSAVRSYTITLLNAAGSPVGESRTVPESTRSATFTGLTNGADYSFRIVATNDRGGSDPVAAGPARPSRRPDAVARVNAVARTGEIGVDWTAPDFDGGSPLLDYTVTLRRTSDGTAVGQPQTLPKTTQSATFPITDHGVAYYATVTARNVRGSSDPARSADVTPYAPVNLGKAITNPKASYGPGDLVEFTLTFQHSNLGQVPSVTIVDTPAPGLRILGSTLQANPLCRASGSACTVTTDAAGRSVATIAPAALPQGTSTLTYSAEVPAGTRSCQTLSNTAGITDPTGTRTSPASTLLACDAGLGLESWWSTLSAAVGPKSTLSVNVSNGNTVLQATDSTPVQARGHLSYALRRTYNSSSRPTITLPGSIGAGWTFNFGEVDDADGISTAGSALLVPSLATALDTVTDPLAVTLVDRDGTRHAFRPRVTTAIAAAGSSAGSGVFEALKPSGSTLCVDVSYDSPKGVHLGLWRYVATTSSSCRLTAADSPVVVGFAAVRPDRLRTDYDATGRLLQMTDGSGVSMRYLYGSPTSGLDAGRLTAVFEPRSCPDAPSNVTRDTLPGTCRSFRFDYSNSGPTANPPSVTVYDPADRRTVYELDKTLPTTPTDPAAHLTRVVNDDGSTVQYRYGGCGGNPDQLCQVIDPRQATTSLAYASNSSDPAGSPARTATLTDRRGTRWTIDYTSSSRTIATAGNSSSGTAADRATPGRQQVFSNIDSDGRVGLREDYDLASGERLHKTEYGWDRGSCRRPDGRDDNNLCFVQRYAAGKSTAGPGSSGVDVPDGTPDERTEYLYTPEGQVLRQRQVLGGGEVLDTTYGYLTQYVRATTTTVAEDKVQGRGEHTLASSRQQPSTLFAITDRVEVLTPRGNSSSVGTGWPAYLTRHVVDNNPGVGVNNIPANASCSTTTDPARPNDTPRATGNTGLICQTSSPSATGNGPSLTRATYDSFGQKTTATTAKAIQETAATAVPPATRYRYFDDASASTAAAQAPVDVSGTVRMGGWLRDVTDPLGGFVAFDYDAAGNAVRTWDRDATAGRSPNSYPGPLTSVRQDPATPSVPSQHAGARYGTGSTAFSRPWRYLRASSNPLGERTEYGVDPNGNVTAVRPPRGTSAANGVGSDAFDVKRSYDAGDLLTTEATPLQWQATPATSTRHSYDPFGNRTSTVGPDTAGETAGRHAIVRRYDAADRLTATLTSRGPAPSGTTPVDCAPAAAEHAPLPAGQTFCRTTTSYDHVDNPTAASDGNAVISRTRFDAVHRPIETRTPRGNNGIAEVRTATVYDPDSRPLRVCGPRHFTEGTGSTTGTCGTDAVHAVHSTYNDAGLTVTTTSYRDSGQPLTTALGYDSDGNLTSSTDPRGTAEDGTDVTVRASFDLLGRRTSSTVPRAGTTLYLHSPSGDLLATAAPGTTSDNPGGPPARITAASYDAAHRPVDTVQALQVSALTLPAVQQALTAAVSDASTQTNLRSRVRYDADGRIVVRYSPRAFTGTGQTGTAALLAAPDERFATRTSYDRDGRPVTELQPRADDNATADPTDDPSQQSQCRTGVNGYPAAVQVCRTDLGYDALGNLTSVALPTRISDTDRSRLIDYRYSDDNLLQAVTGPDPADDSRRITLAQTTFDGAGRPVQRTNAAQHTSSTTYTSDGLVAATTGPNGRDGLSHTVAVRYNADGQPTIVETPRSTFDAATGARNGSDTPITVVDYYADGLTRAVTTGRTLTTPVSSYPTVDLTISYGYDKAGNASTVTSAAANAKEAPNPAGAPVQHSWTADNLLAAVTTPVQTSAAGVSQSRVVRYGYDPAGRKTSTQVALTGDGATDGGTQTFGYYPSDRLAAQNGRSGQGRIGHAYDAAGNPIAVTDSTSGSTVTGSFYLDDLAREVVADGRRTAYAYDGSGALTTRADGPASGTLATTRYQRNHAGLPATLEADGGTSSYGYNSLGQPVRLQRPNGQVQDWAYDSDDLLRSTAVRTSAGSELARWEYTYDELSRIINQAYSGQAASPLNADPGSGSGPAGLEQATPTPVSYRSTYDTAGRLSSFTDARGTRSLRFDRNHNRLLYGDTGQPDPSSWTYRADDSIASSTTSDLLGSTTRTFSYAPFGGVLNDGCSRYTYDGFDRLASTAGSGCTSEAVEYGYDGLDRQIRRIVGGSTTTLTYDGWGHGVTQQSSSAVGSPPLRSTLDAAGWAITASKGNTREYLVDDGTGSTGLAVAAEQSVRCLSRYDAYGSPNGNTVLEPTGSCASGSSHNDDFYRGERRDVTTGQYQLGSRTYDPTKASFLTPDSYRTGGSMANAGVGIDPLTRNNYSYVNGDPLNLTDPDGHKPQCGSGSACRTWERQSDQRGHKLAKPALQRQAAYDQYLEFRRLDRKKADQNSLHPREERRLADLRQALLLEMRLKQSARGPGPSFEARLIAIGDALLFDDLEACQGGSKTSCVLIGSNAVPLTKLGKLGALVKAAEAGGAADAANGVRLGQQLARESAESAFAGSGRLSGGAIAESRMIVPGSKFGNKELVDRLTADGSAISDWAKYTTRTYGSPSGEFQVHFYMNRSTGVIDYGYDYKVVFNGAR